MRYQVIVGLRPRRGGHVDRRRRVARRARHLRGQRAPSRRVCERPRDRASRRASRRRRRQHLVGAGGLGARAAQPGRDPADPGRRRAAHRHADVLRRSPSRARSAGSPTCPAFPTDNVFELVRAVRDPARAPPSPASARASAPSATSRAASTTACCWRPAPAGRCSSGRSSPASPGPRSHAGGVLGRRLLVRGADSPTGRSACSCSGWRRRRRGARRPAGRSALVSRLPDQPLAGPILQIGIFFTMFLPPASSLAARTGGSRVARVNPLTPILELARASSARSPATTWPRSRSPIARASAPCSAVCRRPQRLDPAWSWRPLHVLAACGGAGAGPLASVRPGGIPTPEEGKSITR